MPIPIPIGSNYSCSVSGTTFKIVQCEQCRNFYVYRMTRTGSGSATQVLFLDAGASEVAGVQAHAEMQRKLQEECDPVPCRTCGRYQEHMVAAMKRNFQAKQLQAAKIMLWLGVPVGVLGVLRGFVGPEPDPAFGVIFTTVAVGLLLLGCALIGIRSYLLKEYEPNAANLEERMEIASVYAKTLEEFRSWLAERGIAVDLSTVADTQEQSTSKSKSRRRRLN